MHCTVRRPMALPRSTGDHGALSPSIAHRPACCPCQQRAARPAVVLQTPASRRLAARQALASERTLAAESAISPDIYLASWLLSPACAYKICGTAPLAGVIRPHDPYTAAWPMQPHVVQAVLWSPRLASFLLRPSSLGSS